MDLDSAIKPASFEYSINLINAVREVHKRALPRLADKDKCRSIQDRMEHFALRIQQNFVVTYLVQVLYTACNRAGFQDQAADLLPLCRESAVACVRAYVDMRSFSTAASRTWSLTFAALNAALALDATTRAEDGERTKELQRSLLSCISRSEDEDGDSSQTALHARYAGAFSDLSRMCDANMNDESKADSLEARAQTQLMDPLSVWQSLFSENVSLNRQATAGALSQQLPFGV